jgi:hypothetical protein
MAQSMAPSSETGYEESTMALPPAAACPGPWTGSSRADRAGGAGGVSTAAGVAVAALLATDEAFSYADRSAELRVLVVRLQSEGWRYLQLAGSTYTGKTHKQAYATFAERVEQILESDLGAYYRAYYRGESEPQGTADRPDETAPT